MKKITIINNEYNSTPTTIFTNKLFLPNNFFSYNLYISMFCEILKSI